MSRPRLLCVLSADFGEYVTASLFARRQPLDVHFALPPALAAFVPAGQRGHSSYRTLEDAARLVASTRPDVVLLASGYLFAVNRLAAPEELAAFLGSVRDAGAALATTDPWLRIWALEPGTRYAIHSVPKGGEDTELSARMTALQAALEGMLAGVPHVFAVPLADEKRAWRPFFNPEFAPRAAAEHREGGEWLFVLSREDYVLLAGLEREAFFAGLEERVAELLGRRENRLRFVAPPEIGRFLAERWADEPRLAYSGFCDFASFERLVREATVVAYWNLLSSSLLYCLYYGVAPIFFDRGHLAKVCPGLESHAARHVYRGRPPRVRNLADPLAADAGRLVEEEGLHAWLEGLRREYAEAPPPSAVLAAIRGSR
jgi:hypothetical protein